MAAVDVEVCQAVTDLLNGNEFALAFTAERAYVPIHKLAVELETLRVTVVPSSLAFSPTIMNRAQQQQVDTVLDIGVQRLTDKTLADMDELRDLVQELIDFFFGRAIPLDSGREMRVVAAGNDPVYEPGHFDEFNLFTSVVTLTCRMVR